MRKTRILLIIIPLLLCLTALIGVSILILSVRPITYEISGLSQVDRIEVYLNREQHLKTIDDPDEISRVVEKIRYTDKWQYDQFSPPYTSSFGKPNPVWLIFYYKDKKSVALTLGYSKQSSYSLQEVYGPGRYLEYGEFKELIESLGLDEETAYYESE